jgi:hypothetical protein
MTAVLARLALGQTKMRYVLLVCAVLSLALHAVVLSAHFSPESSRRTASDAARNVVSMRVRTISSAPSLPLPVGKSTQTIEVLYASSQAADPMMEPPKDTAPAALPSSLAAEADNDSYVPRNQLSRPPVAKTPVVLESPLGEITASRLIGILSLFIDEQGRVQRIDAEEPALPRAFEQVAREAFLAAEFLPGEVAGRAVKSIQRVEVVFDNTQPSAP